MTSEKININFHNLSDDFLIGVYNLSLQQVILKHLGGGQLLTYTRSWNSSLAMSWLRNMNNCL